MSNYDESSTSDSEEIAPSKWQHWDPWVGPWYKGDKIVVNNVRSGKIVKLVAHDNENIISVSYEALLLSVTIKNLLEDTEFDINNIIPFNDVSYVILNKIVEYLEWLFDHPKHDEWNINKNEEFSNWEREFINIDYNILNDLCMASNYLDIKPLLKLTCNKIAKILSSIPPEEIGKKCQKYFKTANDINEEDYKQIMDDHSKYFGMDI